MAHLTSYQISSAVGVLRHNERKENDTVHQRKNECITPERTHLNYNLAPQRDMSLSEHIKAVCAENNIRLNNRKDLNVMSSWIITIPKDFLEKEKESENTYQSIVKPYSDKKLERQFFEETYSFLQKRYGKENVLSACVHLDETTPHIHYEFIPVGIDKNGVKTVSSKLVCTRKDLQSFHRDLSKHLEHTFGRKISIENGATVEGNKAISELKKQSATEKLREANENASKIVAEARGEVDTIMTSIAPLRAEYEAKKAYVAECKKASEISVAFPEYAKVSKTLLGKEFVTVPKDKWIVRHMSIVEKQAVNTAKDVLDNKLQCVVDENTELHQAHQSVVQQNIKLKQELSRTRVLLEAFQIKSNPEKEEFNIYKQYLIKHYPKIKEECEQAVHQSRHCSLMEVTSEQFENLKQAGINFEQRKIENKNIIRYEKLDEELVQEILEPKFLSQDRGLSL